MGGHFSWLRQAGRRLGFFTATILAPILAVLAAAPLPAASGPIDSQEAETFASSIFGEWMEQYQVPGAVFTLVHNGEVLLARGWGLAEVASGREMNAESSVFRLGFGTQLVAPIALQQLRSRGLVAVDTDVNRYLERFQLKTSGLEPVTPHHLMVHTAGLDETFLDMNSPSDAARPSIGDFLAARPPQSIRVAGQVRTHSPPGNVLLAHLVEAVSGETFAEYSRRHLFVPLGMSRTDFVPPQALAEVAASYRFRDAEHRPLPFSYSHVDRELYTTASDIGRLMVALLEGSEVEGLGAEQRSLYLTRQFGHHPVVPGPTYGLNESFHGEQVAVLTSSVGSGHTCELFLLPRERTGFFFCANTMQFGLVEDFNARFMAHYYPAPARPEKKTVDAAQSRAAEYPGTYRHTRFPRRTLDKMPAILSGFIREVEVTASPEGSFTVFGDNSVETAPLVLERLAPTGGLIVPTHDGTVAFGTDAAGRVDRMFAGSAAFDKVPWWETQRSLRRITITFVAVYLVALLIVPAAAVWVRRRRRAGPDPKPGAPMAWLVLWLHSLLALAFLAGLYHYLDGGIKLLYFHLPKVVHGLLFIPFLTTALAAVMAVYLIAIWRRHAFSVAARCFFLLEALAAVAFVPFLHYWNLLGFNY